MVYNNASYNIMWNISTVAFIVVVCWYTSSVYELKIKFIITRKCFNVILYNNTYSAHSGVRRVRRSRSGDERLERSVYNKNQQYDILVTFSSGLELRYYVFAE
uniref:Uncharacterized protein n=1 Tax=Sipha flava TaxID=143950 RepID=A0A2S2R720_9HEMI